MLLNLVSSANLLRVYSIPLSMTELCFQCIFGKRQRCHKVQSLSFWPSLIHTVLNFSCNMLMFEKSSLTSPLTMSTRIISSEVCFKYLIWCRALKVFLRLWGWWLFWCLFLDITLELLELSGEEKLFQVQYFSLMTVTWFNFLLYVCKIKWCNIFVFYNNMLLFKQG